MTPPNSQYCEMHDKMAKDIEAIKEKTWETHGLVSAMAQMKGIKKVEKSDGNGGNVIEFKGKFLGQDATKVMVYVLLALQGGLIVVLLKLGAI